MENQFKGKQVGVTLTIINFEEEKFDFLSIEIGRY